MRIGIYRDRILPYSQTFIVNQARSIEEYVSFIGISRNKGLSINGTDSAILSDYSKFWRVEQYLFKLFGLVNFYWLKRIKSLNIDAIHAHFGVDALWASHIAKKLCLPLISTFHGYDICFKKDYTHIPSRIYRYYYSNRYLVFQRSTKIIAVSEFIKTKLIEAGCPEGKIIVHYIGVDTNEFSFNLYGREEEVVLFVGRLIEYKGCEDLLDAMKILQLRGSNYKLVIIGDGKLRDYLVDKARKLGINADFLGIQPPSVVKDWMSRATIFVGPSHEIRSGQTEALGMVFLEAQASGLPVIAYDTGGVKEVIDNGYTGITVKEKDTDSLANSIEFLLSNPDIRREMAILSRTNVEKNFNISIQAQKLSDIYESSIEDFHGRPKKA